MASLFISNKSSNKISHCSSESMKRTCLAFFAIIYVVTVNAQTGFLRPFGSKFFCRYLQSTIPSALATAFLMKALMVMPSLLAAIAAPL